MWGSGLHPHITWENKPQGGDQIHPRGLKRPFFEQFLMEAPYPHAEGEIWGGVEESHVFLFLF